MCDKFRNPKDSFYGLDLALIIKFFDPIKDVKEKEDGVRSFYRF